MLLKSVQCSASLPLMKQLIAVPKWAIFPSFASLLLIVGTLFFVQRDSVNGSAKVSASTVESALVEPGLEAEQGTLYQLTYEGWVNQLRREANAIAHDDSKPLSILAGDSLSLWFPNDLLPKDSLWLNQGISGETSYGLLRRVKILDQSKPRVIFVMIGINDLIRGVREVTLVANQQEIIRHLKAAHPQARIVVQSILPHRGEHASKRYLASTKDDPAPDQNPRPLWVDRLPKIPNQRIAKLNQKLAKVAQQEKVEYLDLYSLFIDDQGYLHEDLTTDGLHLSTEGYTVWRSQLEQLINKPEQVSVSP